MASSEFLSSLEDGPEALIVRSFFDVLRADQQLSGPQGFSPWQLVDTPTRVALLEYAVATATVQPLDVKYSDKPSKRETVLLDILVAFYLPIEQTTERSKLFSLLLANRLRKIVWGGIAGTMTGAVLKDPVSGLPITFANPTMAILSPVVNPASAVRILSYRVHLETDINPTDGSFI